MPKTKVLVGSPVYQKPSILKVFLESLQQLVSETIDIDFMLVDDHESEESSQLLHAFSREGSNIRIWEGESSQDAYLCDESGHHWKRSIVQKISDYKNKIIEIAKQENYDHLFLIDSDLIIHPNLIEHLKSDEKDIVAELFWSQWDLDTAKLPNCWLFDNYDMVPRDLSEDLSAEESHLRYEAFLYQLSEPGVYEVGGLGACTLISRQALCTGVNFSAIKNLAFMGEDRFFCIRAAVLGLKLFIDTHYPAYHIYRDSDLRGVDAYVRSCKWMVKNMSAAALAALQQGSKTN